MNPQKRAARRRHSIREKSTRSRLSVHRSRLNIYAQIIDDTQGKTLAQASSMDKEFKTQNFKGTGIQVAQAVGELLATRAIKAGVSEIVFDKGAYAYHGRVAALADGARSKGLEF